MGEKKLLRQKDGCLCDGSIIIGNHYHTPHKVHESGVDFIQDHVFKRHVEFAIEEHFGLGYCFRCGKSLDLMNLIVDHYSPTDGTPVYRVNYKCKEGGYFSRHFDQIFYLGKIGPEKIWYIEKGLDGVELNQIYG